MPIHNTGFTDTDWNIVHQAMKMQNSWPNDMVLQESRHNHKDGISPHYYRELTLYFGEDEDYDYEIQVMLFSDQDVLVFSEVESGDIFAALAVRTFGAVNPLVIKNLVINHVTEYLRKVR